MALQVCRYLPMCPPEGAAQEVVPSAHTCAIVVTWQPDQAALKNLLNALLKQGCKVIVIDNGSSEAQSLAAMINALSAQISLTSWPDNRGLAAALNEGLRLAAASSLPYALLFDQDSAIKDSFCQDMMGAMEKAQALSSRPVAALGPRLQDPDSGRRTPFRVFGLWRRSDRRHSGATDLYTADFLITSGTLLPVAVLADIGLMKEEYFIDNIDLEWCFRATAAGYALYGTDAATLYHRIGENADNPLVKAGLMVQHSPLRSYYTSRNRLHLYRQAYAPLDWKIRDVCRFILKTAYTLLFSPQRRDYWQHIRRGIADAGKLS
jgi:rhamnosyltransferase